MLRLALPILKWASSWSTPIYVGGQEDPYMVRWFLIPRNRVVNAYLHQFLRSDDDRAMRDHPWYSLALLLDGRYIENDDRGSREYRAGNLRFRSATYRHQIELIDGQHCWTLFLTGPRLRDWGFHCPWGWRHWREFTTGRDGERVGKGCD